MAQVNTNTIVGTWTESTFTPLPNGASGPVQATIQFLPNGTWREIAFINGQPGAYVGVYIYDHRTQRIAYQVNGAVPGSPAPTPTLNTPTLSKTVFFGSNTPGNPSTMAFNNDLMFNFKSASVSPADFVLPPPPTPTVRPPGTRLEGDAGAGFLDGGHAPVAALLHALG